MTTSRWPSTLRLLAPMILALTVAACGKSDQPAAQSTAAATAPASWSAYRDQFLDAYFKAHPAFAVIQGRHEYDGRLPDWSAAGIAAEIKRLHAARDATSAFADATLSEAERFERDYLIARVDRDLFWLEIAEAPFKNPAFYVDWISDGLDPAPYLTREYAPLEQRMRAYIGYLRAVPAAAQQIRTNLRAPLALPLLERGVSAFNGFADFFEHEAPATFASVTDASLQSDLKQASTVQRRQCTSSAAGWMRSVPQPPATYALGAEKFATMIRDDRAGHYATHRTRSGGARRPGSQSRALCVRHVQSTRLEGRSPRASRKMNEDKPTGGAVEGARQQLAGLKQFLIDKQVVTIPGDEQARVDEAPPYNRANSAYIDIPGPYEKGLPATYYIAPPDPTWSEQERRDYIPGRADLLFTSVHEVWPGHFLQFLHSNRSGSIVGRVFVGYAFAEGWAHYAEEMMWEMDFGNGDPETHIGQLSNALLRNVRFLSAIGLHTHGMTVAESERMFRESAFQDPGTARQQAARGTYDPGVSQLHHGQAHDPQAPRGVERKPGRAAAWHDFHDQILSYGGPPIPMIRRCHAGEGRGPFVLTRSDVSR